MKKILLIFPAIFNSKSEVRYPPFGLLEMASYLQKHNIAVNIYDRNLENNSLDRLWQDVQFNKYDYIGISAMFIQKDDANLILNNLCKIKKSKIILGGDYFITYKHKYNSLADFIVCGEGELFFEALANDMVNSDIIQYPLSLTALDSIPIPSQIILDQVAWDKKIFSLKTSRGCPFSCIFCSEINNGKKIRYYSSSYIFEYIKFIYNTYGISKFRFLDDVFTLNKERVIELCRLIIKSNLPIEITECFSHASICEKEMFNVMKSANFRSIQIGIESANNDILKLIGKKITGDDVLKSIYAIVESGLKAEGLFMIGNIGDTYETITESIEFARQLPTYKDWFSYACPLPNSPFFELAKKEGTIICDELNYYTNSKIVFVPKGMTKNELEILMIQARDMVRKKIITNARKKG